jgi:hypothetical protein
MSWISARDLKPGAVVLVAAVLLALLTVYWVRGDTGIGPPSDSEHHLLSVQLAARALQERGPQALYSFVRGVIPSWPPLVYFVEGTLAWLIGGERVEDVRVLGLAFLPLLLFGLFGLVRPSAGRVAWAVAAVLALYTPGISGAIRQVSLDLPAAATVAWCLSCLLAAWRFDRPREAVVLGLALGICLLTRIQALFFVVGPFVYAALGALGAPHERGERRRRTCLLAVAVLVALVVSSPYWLGRLQDIAYVMTAHLDPKLVTPRGDPSLAGGLYHYLGALGVLPGWPLLISAVITLPLVLKRRPREAIALLLGIAGGILGCVIGVHRESRYLLPVTPLVVVLAVLGLSELGALARGLCPPRELLRARLARVLGALLIGTTVSATLAAMVIPQSAGAVPVRLGLVEWTYSRWQVRDLYVEEGLEKIASALRSFSPADRTGQGLFVVIVRGATNVFIPRVVSFLCPSYPRLLWSTIRPYALTETRWQMDELSRRRVLLLVEGKEPGLRTLYKGLVPGDPRRTSYGLYLLPAHRPYRELLDAFQY